MQTETTYKTEKKTDEKSFILRLLEEEQLIQTQMKLMKQFMWEWINFCKDESAGSYDTFIKDMKECCEINKLEIDLLIQKIESY